MAGESIIAILLHELAIIWYDDAIVGALSFSPPSHLNAWLRHSVCSFVCRFLQAACEVGSSRQESKPSAVPCLILLLYAFFFTEYFISLCFTIPLRIPLQHFLWKVIRIRCFLFWWSEQHSSLARTNKYLIYLQVPNTMRVSRFLQRCWQNLESSGTWRRVDW